ncbi:MAG: MBL fold metallo-hydrolase [Flavobacteriales bacterium]|nr:MBL fold metallo-hydrolase [Flavobacteriales bacterium]MCB9174601.1 MBL fold metallo-hydrolase [Flavobacteriales bacterium]
MYVEQLYTGCLAEAAYYIESNGEAAIIDPLRETFPYTELAEKRGAKIKYVFETHFHADFVSGHVDLAKKTGATIVYGPTATAGYKIHVGKDNEEFKIGNIKIKLLHTPGHTPESSTYLLIDEHGENHAIFSGDTLFLGDVGRPDLAIKSDVTEKDLAGMLFDSLRNKIMPLADEVIVYPGHGAGSACGKNMSKETVGTIGEQKKTNYALRETMTKDEFVKELLHGILPPPQYFPKNAMMNKNGYKSIDEVMAAGLKPLSVDEFEKEKNDAIIIDTRTQGEFKDGFIPSSIFIGLNGQFAVWVGALITNLNQKIIIVSDEGKEEESVLRLARVGYDNCVGYLKGGFKAWANAGKPVETITSISALELEKIANAKPVHIIDVRKPTEYQSERLEQAESFPLDNINNWLNHLDKNETKYLHCAGGYRSMIAISMLRKEGYQNIIDVAGGSNAIFNNTTLSKTAYVCPSTL